jgi:hypothetical protein
MEAIKKQATRLREQVAKQQQVINFSSDSLLLFFFFFFKFCVCLFVCRQCWSIWDILVMKELLLTKQNYNATSIFKISTIQPELPRCSYLFDLIWFGFPFFIEAKFWFFLVFYFTLKYQHFQKNIVRGAEGFVSISSKQMEICEYGFCFVTTLLWFVFFEVDMWDFWLRDFLSAKVGWWVL